MLTWARHYGEQPVIPSAPPTPRSVATVSKRGRKAVGERLIDQIAAVLPRDGTPRPIAWIDDALRTMDRPTIESTLREWACARAGIRKSPVHRVSRGMYARALTLIATVLLASVAAAQEPRLVDDQMIVVSAQLWTQAADKVVACGVPFVVRRLPCGVAIKFHDDKQGHIRRAIESVAGLGPLLNEEETE